MEFIKKHYEKILLCAVLLGLATGMILAIIDTLAEPQVIVLAPAEPAPYEVSALIEEARRIAREAAGD